MTISSRRARATEPPGMFHFDINGWMTDAKLSSGVTPFVPSPPPPLDDRQQRNAAARIRMTDARKGLREEDKRIEGSGRVLKHRAAAFSTLFLFSSLSGRRKRSGRRTDRQIVPGGMATRQPFRIASKQRPPRSTLCPSSTLFRSRVLKHRAAARNSSTI